MKTPHTIFKIAKLRSVIVLWTAVALVAINAVPYPVAAKGTKASNAVATQTLTALPLTGTFQVITNFHGDEFLPRIDGDQVTYVHDDFFGFRHLRLFNFATNMDQEIPSNGTVHSPDISGNRLAFIEWTIDGHGPRTVVLDTISQTRSYVPGFGYLWTSLGGNLLAVENRTFSPTDHDWWLSEGEIGLYDLTTGTLTSLTNDDRFDRTPEVSPTGNAVVWKKCQTNESGCDIYSAIQTAPGVFSTTALTATLGEEQWPATNGQIAVYTSTRNGETDVYFQPVAGGVETHLSIPGDQFGTRISGNLICFNSLVQHENLQTHDIFVYDLNTAKLYQATDTLFSESLSDILVHNGVARIVYGFFAADIDISSFTFNVPTSTEDQINDLIELIESFGLPRGPENSLITKLDDALAAVASGDTATACSSLTAFINESSAQSGKKLTADQAAQLITAAQEIKSDLGCQ